MLQTFVKLQAKQHQIKTGNTKNFLKGMIYKKKV